MKDIFFPNDGKIRVACLTGNHPMDVPRFQQFLRSIPDADIYVQHMDDFSYEYGDKVRRLYDVVLFFSYILPTPADEGVPWFVGRPKKAIEEVIEAGQGIFIWHHSLVEYRQWPFWDEVIGIPGRTFKSFDAQTLRIEVANPDHPITRGLEAFEILDEAYKMTDAGEGSEMLLTTEHPNSLRTIGWTRQYKKSRVFCLELGHDNWAWSNPSFRVIFERGIRW